MLEVKYYDAKPTNQADVHYMQALFMAKGSDFVEAIPESQLQYLEFAVEHLMTKQLTLSSLANLVATFNIPHSALA